MVLAAARSQTARIRSSYSRLEQGEGRSERPTGGGRRDRLALRLENAGRRASRRGWLGVGVRSAATWTVRALAKEMERPGAVFAAAPGEEDFGQATIVADERARRFVSQWRLSCRRRAAFSGQSMACNGIDGWVNPSYLTKMNTRPIIDKAGRVAIPKPLRDELHLERGDALEIESARERIILRPVRGKDRLRRSTASGYCTPGGACPPPRPAKCRGRSARNAIGLTSAKANEGVFRYVGAGAGVLRGSCPSSGQPGAVHPI